MFPWVNTVAVVRQIIQFRIVTSCISSTVWRECVKNARTFTLVLLKNARTFISHQQRSLILAHQYRLWALVCNIIRRDGKRHMRSLMHAVTNYHSGEPHTKAEHPHACARSYQHNYHHSDIRSTTVHQARAPHSALLRNTTAHAYSSSSLPSQQSLPVEFLR